MPAFSRRASAGAWRQDARADHTLLEPALLARFRDSMAACFGDHGLGLALASLQVKFYSALTGLCVVRCSREQHRQVRLPRLSRCVRRGCCQGRRCVQLRTSALCGADNTEGCCFSLL